MMIAPIFAMLLTPAHATDVQVGAALSLDGSMGLNTMGWGDGPVRPYHTLGAGLAITGGMDTALAPALPLGLVGGGVEIRRDQLWVRAGLQGFFAPAPALGLGPELIAGWSF